MMMKTNKQPLLSSTMFVLLLLLSSLLVVTSSASLNTRDIQAGSRLGQKLLSQARPVEINTASQNSRWLDQNNNNEYSFLANYKLKFQGCHHVSQWNPNNNNDDNDVRIMTKRLVRFRLCPSDQCSNDKSAGCTSKYGDYIVDMNTFVSAYLEALTQDENNICNEVAYDCQEECGTNNNDNNQDCIEACYDAYQVSYCLNAGNDNNEQQQDNNNNGIWDALEYAECAQVNLNGRRHLEEGNNNNNNNGEYFVGPYCADQGGEIHLGLFSDDTCTTFVQNGESTFYSAMGYELPFSDDSLVSNRCMSCSASYNNNDNNNQQQVKDVCNNIYGVSGKCETKMNMDAYYYYPNESACTYIDGIKIVRADGVIRTSAVRKSKAAAVVIGLLLTFSVLLAAYVYYLRTKLSRARISLVSPANASEFT